MIKVLYLSYDGMTDPLGQSQVIPYLQGLSKLGYEFTIISFEKKDRLEKNGAYIRAMLDGSGIKWRPQIFSKRPPVLAKLYDLWKLNRAVTKAHKEEQFAFTHCRSYIAAGAGLDLFRKFKVPYLFDIRGFWVDERVDNGQWNLKNPIHNYFYKTFKKKEKNYFKYARHIISLTWKGKEELINHYGVTGERITVIPCCVDLAHFDYKKVSPELLAEKRQELKINPSDKIITYLGSFGGWYLLKEMFDFFLEMKKVIPEAKFLFITQSPYESVVNAANSCGADIKDLIVQPASRKEVPVYLALSNWTLFFIKDGYSKIASSPTKQGEIMAMGIPIICNDVGDTGKIIEDSHVGLLVHSFDSEGYREVISKIDELQYINKEKIRESAHQYYDLNMGVERYAGVYRSHFQTGG